MKIRRRIVLSALLSAASVATVRPALAAAPDDVKFAVVAPLSGPWGRAGQFIVDGARMAVDEINQSGGIKALGGAKVVLVTADAGDTADKAKSAVQRLLSQEPGLVGGTGAWLSSFTLAITEVTEREKLPWLTISYADSITSRGFRYVFQTAPTGSRFTQEVMPALLDILTQVNGTRPKTVALLGDNTAASQSFAKPIVDTVAKANGLEVVANEVYTPPLSDATSIVRKVRSANPDLAVLLTSNVPDMKLVLDKMAEFRMNGKVALYGGGGHLGSPELGQTVRPDALDGLFFSVANWTTKGMEGLAQRYVARTGEPYMPHEAIGGYGDMWVLKEAIEQAGSADRVKVGEALHRMNLTTGPAAVAYPGGVRFAENGLRTNARILLVQWQHGTPVVVSPPELAIAKPLGTRR